MGGGGNGAVRMGPGFKDERLGLLIFFLSGTEQITRELRGNYEGFTRDLRGTYEQITSVSVIRGNRIREL